jgi:hypothetical protein
MLSAQRLNVLEYPLQGRIIERRTQRCEVVKENPSLASGDTSFFLADKQGIENLRAPKGRH